MMKTHETFALARFSPSLLKLTRHFDNRRTFTGMRFTKFTANLFKLNTLSFSSNTHDDVAYPYEVAT